MFILLTAEQQSVMSNVRSSHWKTEQKCDNERQAHLGLQHGVLRLVVLQRIQQERRRLPHCVALRSRRKRQRGFSSTRIALMSKQGVIRAILLPLAEVTT